MAVQIFEFCRCVLPCFFLYFFLFCHSSDFWNAVPSSLSCSLPKTSQKSSQVGLVFVQRCLYELQSAKIAAYNSAASSGFCNLRLCLQTDCTDFQPSSAENAALNFIFQSWPAVHVTAITCPAAHAASGVTNFQAAQNPEVIIGSEYDRLTTFTGLQSAAN